MPASRVDRIDADLRVVEHVRVVQIGIEPAVLRAP